MIGYPSSRRMVLRKALVALIVNAILFGQIPLPAWAELAASAPEVAFEAVQGVDEPADAARTPVEPDPSDAPPAPGGEADTAGLVGAEPGNEPAPTAGPAPNMEPEAVSTSGKSPVAVAESDSPDVALGAQPARALPLEDDHHILIQDEKDKDDSYSVVRGVPKAGATLWANVYDYDDWIVEGQGNWSYQWMVSSEKTANEAKYTPIDGQTAQSLTLTDDLARQLAGTYIGVRISDASMSLWAPSGLFYVIGPVQNPDAPMLSRVEMHRAGVKVSGDIDAILHPGDAVDAVAMAGGSPYPGASNGQPATKGVTYSWTLLPSKGATTGEALGTQREVRIPLGDEALGRYLRVEASTQAGSVEHVMGPIAPSGALRLANISIKVKGGGSVTDRATLVAKPVLTAGVIPPAGSVSYQWWKGTGQTGPFEKIPGATGSELALSGSMVGSHIKVTATAGGYNEVSATEGPILAADSAKAAKAALDGYTPQPRFGGEENVRELVEGKLRELGFDQASVRVKSAATGDGGATVDAGEGARNGRVTFYYEDPEGTSVAGHARVQVVFEIASGGSTVEWTRWISVRWDMGRVRERLEQLVDEELTASSLVRAEGGAADNAANAVEARKDLILTSSVGSCADVTWATDDAGVVKADGKLVRRQSQDATTNLKATIRFSGADAGEQPPVLTKTFKVTVKSIDSDPTVEQVLDRALADIVLKDMGTHAPVDPSSIAGDVQLPTVRAMGLRGNYKVKYSLAPESDGSCSVTGFRLNVTRPAPGFPPARAVLIVRLSKGAVVRTRSIDITVKPLETDDIDRELALMQSVKDNFAQALMGENTDPRAISKSLRSFQQARADGSGGLIWARAHDEVTGSGIVPVSIDLTHPSEQWDRFKSSAPTVIESETLRLVKAPLYNTRVTITSCLSSEKYADYYNRLKDDPAIDPDVLAKYRALSRQEVTASFTVRGTTGVDDPNAEKALLVSARVMGLSKKGVDGAQRRQAWVPLTEVEVGPGESATAWDVFAGLLDGAGYTYSMEHGGVPYSITTPDGSRTLAMSASAPWSYWSFLVNGEYASTYANAHIVSDGDVIELVYVDGSGNVQPEYEVEVLPDAPRPDWASPWPGFTASTKPTAAPTPTGAAEEKWTVMVGDAAAGSYGVPDVSDPILVGDYLYIASADHLLMKDPATGETVRAAQLAARIDSTARMVYAEGLIVVPLHGGRIQALTADTLTTVWVTQALPSRTTSSGSTVEQQSLGTLTVRDGYVYAGTSDGSSGGSGYGYLTCVSLATGALRWQQETPGGYYWAGACALGPYMVIGDDTGLVRAFDPATGQTVGTPFNVGAMVRSTVVTDGQHLYVADYKGVLHKLAIQADGSIVEIARVACGMFSTSTPALVNGKIVMCGRSATQGAGRYRTYAAIFVVDTATMRLEREVCDLSGGGKLPAMSSQSSPLVSVQGEGAYVYFTVNWNPSGLYRYKIGDSAVDVIFIPSDDHQQYCLNSVVAGPDGTLYYKNDSGALFAVKGASAPHPGGDGPSGPGEDADGSGANPGGSNQDHGNPGGSNQDHGNPGGNSSDGSGSASHTATDMGGVAGSAAPGASKAHSVKQGGDGASRGQSAQAGSSHARTTEDALTKGSKAGDGTEGKAGELAAEDGGKASGAAVKPAFGGFVPGVIAVTGLIGAIGVIAASARLIVLMRRKRQ